MVPRRGESPACGLRPGQRRRAARYLRGLRLPGRGSICLPLPGRHRPQAPGIRSTGSRGPGHLRGTPATDPLGPGPPRLFRGNDQPRLPPGAPGGRRLPPRSQRPQQSPARRVCQGARITARSVGWLPPPMQSGLRDSLVPSGI
ncbi:hypothetical protein NDU88_005959 [Pleurodeles waltl]|uniref:Uncharacterized protein n=1 Tax=Pleurodeles waltl TaxID=8319 RepID=A0AAV7LQJ0_PLEWA|nr:hypothetical protein NDU88_005959 [Pleurodeles waltl]